MKSIRHWRGGMIVVLGLAALIGSRELVDRRAPASQRQRPHPLAPPAPPAPQPSRAAIQARLELMESESHERFDQPDQAAAFWLEQRLPPGKTRLPLEQLLEARRELTARERDLAQAQQTQQAGIQGWSSLGPGNIGGRTRTLVIDPANPAVMYAGGVSGGVWKTTDGGANWFATDDQMLNLAVNTLVMDPTDPSVLYAGTGEGFDNGFVRGLGIFKTMNGGGTWAQLPGTVTAPVGEGFYWVNKLVISPNDHNRIYAGTRHGVWRSLDAGGSWTLLLANPIFRGGPSLSNGSSMGCTDLAIRSDRNPDVLFAAFGSFDADGLFRTDNGGDTWTGYAVPTYQGRMSIAIAPSNNDVIYLTMSDNGGLNQLGRIVTIYKSTDGANFASVLNPNHPFSPWLLSYASIATGCVSAPSIYSQGWYDNAIAVDPVDPNVVWVGGIDLYRSDDGGQNFGMAGYWFYYMQDPPPPTYLHPDQHGIVFHPGYNGTTNQTMYVTNDGGLFKTTNARAATTQEECPIGANPGPPPAIAWSSLNHSYAVTQFYHGDAARTSARVAGGAQDNGTSQVLSANAVNGWDLIFGGDGGYVQIDPQNEQRMFIEIQGFPEIWQSFDGGANFFKAVNGITDTDGLFITPFAMDQNNPSTLWTGGQRPWRTTNGALFWELAGPNFVGGSRISAIAIAPSNSNVVYVGFNNGYVARTANALGASPVWQVFSTGLSIGAWVSSVTVDPVNPDVVYATYSSYGVPHVVRSTNGGFSWQTLGSYGVSGVPDIPAHWLAIRPCNSQLLYLGTELGVFASEDGGATWQPANFGLAHTVVETLDFADDNTLVAFTHGRGAFRASLDPCVVVGVEKPVAAPSPSLRVFPSPFRSSTTVSASLPAEGRVNVSVYDLGGRRIARLVDGVRPAGTLEARWDGATESGRRAAPGVYVVRLEAGATTISRRVVVAGR